MSINREHHDDMLPRPIRNGSGGWIKKRPRCPECRTVLWTDELEIGICNSCLKNKRHDIDDILYYSEEFDDQ